MFDLSLLNHADTFLDEEANENYDVCIELKYFDVNPDVYFSKVKC